MMNPLNLHEAEWGSVCYLDTSMTCFTSSCVLDGSGYYSPVYIFLQLKLQLQWFARLTRS
jgi:hypothetical protein